MGYSHEHGPRSNNGAVFIFSSKNIRIDVECVTRGDEARGKAEGIAEGVEENKLATARTMLSMNYPIEDISKITGLPTKVLKGIK